MDFLKNLVAYLQEITSRSFVFKSWLSSLLRSEFSRNIIWVTGLSGIERIAALVQTVLLARVLGIAEYGVYGLLFGTIGFVGSVMGFQMSLTATVLIAKYRKSEKAKAALVIQYVTQFTLAASLLFIVIVLPFSTNISLWLLASNQYSIAVVVSCLLLSTSLLSGVQDGVLQGFEDFKSITKIKILTAAITLAGIYPIAILYGLEGVMSLFLAGVILKFSVLHWVVAKHRRADRIPKRGAGVRFMDMVFKFSLPSMLLSFVVGAVSWYGIFLLSRQPSGFESVAIVNTGMQWRGPILLLANSIGCVAIPAFSRYAGQQNHSASDHLQRRMLWLNGTAVTFICFLLVFFSGPLLTMYGKEFSGGKMVFAILVVTTIPQILSNVYMQNLVGSGKLWLQLWLHLFLIIPMGVAFVVLIPIYQGIGYAVATAVGAIIFLGSATYTLDMKKRSSIQAGIIK